MYDYFGIFTHHLITQKINTMKRFYFTLVVLCFFTACRHKDCVDVLCLNNGYCSAGDCNCPEGFGGDNCETFLSCETLSPLCPPNATCQMLNNAPVCLCNAGFEGSLCDTLTRSFFTDGNNVYTRPSTQCCTLPELVTDGCMFPIPPVTITNGAAPNEFIINGFEGFDSPPVNVSAYITGKDTFIVPFQTQPDWGLSIEGQENTTGTLNRNEHTITLPYKITYNDSAVDICTVTLTRQ